MPKRKTLKQFIYDAKNVHGNKYDYSKVRYINAHSKVRVICGEHGLFEQSPGHHLRGQGCPECGKESSSANRRKSLEQFIIDARKIHGKKYDYIQVKYIDSCIKVKIKCEKHGIFEQLPDNHLRGQGCPDCRKDNLSAKYQKTQNQFILDARKVHGDRYDYSLVEYTNNTIKIEIICKKHGIFLQTPANHLQGQGCPICSDRVSKPEKQWLESIGLPDDDKHRQVSLPMIDGLKKLVDGYNPETNIVYEFYGDYWHGNPNNKKLRKTKINEKCNKTFKQLYEETLNREELIKDSGYNLIIMWEGDWKI